MMMTLIKMLEKIKKNSISKTILMSERTRYRYTIVMSENNQKADKIVIEKWFACMNCDRNFYKVSII